MSSTSLETIADTIDGHISDNTLTDDLIMHAIEDIAGCTESVNAHQEWETADKNWRSIKDSDAPHDEILLSSTLLRLASQNKDIVLDTATRFVSAIAGLSDVLEDYTEDTIGNATVFGDVLESSPEWHDLRQGGIGGSSLAPMLGFHWMSSANNIRLYSNDELQEIWLDSTVEKSAQIPHDQRDEGTDAGIFYRGHAWEPALLTWYAINTGTRVAVSKKTWVGTKPFEIINLDGILLDKNGVPEGIGECKTASRESVWSQGVPLSYRIQVLYYLKVLGLKYAKVIVRFDSGIIQVFTINADETLTGLDNTQPIEYYLDDVERKWDEYASLRANPMNLYSVHPGLRAERESIRDYDTPEKMKTATAQGYLALGLTLQAPYYRMDSSYTKPVYAMVNGTNIRVSNIPLSLYGVRLEEFAQQMGVSAPIQPYEQTIRESDVYRKIRASGVPVCVHDTLTYEYLKNRSDMSTVKLVNLSALRRFITETPNAHDFTSQEDAQRWLTEFVQS